MLKKIIFLIFLFYFLTLLQTSFLIHFFSFESNLVLITIILINLFESPKSELGIISSFLGGFFLDVFSENWFGYYILISFFISLFIKLVVKNYIQPKFTLSL